MVCICYPKIRRRKSLCDQGPGDTTHNLSLGLESDVSTGLRNDTLIVLL